MTFQQEEVVKRFASGESLACRAVAGSGKTTTLVSAFQKAPPESLALCFNKRNVEDLAARMPSSVLCKSFNALGHGAWSKHIGKRLDVSTKKPWVLWDAYPQKNAFEGDDEAVKEVLSLVRVAKTYGITPGWGGKPTPNLEKWAELAQNQDIDEVSHEMWEAAASLLKANCVAAFEGRIDFDDQLYCSTMFNARFDKYACLAVDEAQDLSGIQHKIVEKSLRKDGQLLVVGDPNQAIYAFRGAEANSFFDLTTQHLLPILPLTFSFRCPRAVTEIARQYVPDIVSWEGAEDGEVLRPETVDIAARRTILARTNAPLISLAFQAIRKGVAVNYLKRDFLGGLKALNKKHPTLERLEKWFEDAMEGAKTHRAKARLRDRFTSLRFLHIESAKSSRSVTEAIERLYVVPKEDALVLTTLHGGKGLEWNDVTFYEHNMMGKEEQEGNLCYVGVTRSKKTLRLHQAVDR